MTNMDVKEEALGDELLRRGWKQGTLFNAPSIYFTYHDLSQSDTEVLTSVQKRNLKANERLIVISQDCDIKDMKQEKYIEAIICKPYNQNFIEKVSQLSARWFVVDPKTRLVAEAKYKIQIAKQVFLQLQPEPWPDSPNRLDEFIRWLARRYDRPALPDAMVEVFQKPIEQEVNSLKEKHPDIFIAFNDAVHNIRVNLPANEDPPFDLYLTFLVRPDGLTEESANAIDFTKELIKTCLDTNVVHLDPDIRILTEEQISMKEYFAGRPLYFDYLTYGGEEIEGAEPYKRM
ncbi:MAG TPA: hypothetical protein VGL94_24675 [Ktedonobacteraceae bacterium]|jgi:hypothetical protein